MVKIFRVVVAVMVLGLAYLSGIQNGHDPVGSGPTAIASDNGELRRLYDEDRADRAATHVEWAAVARRDRARVARVTVLVTGGRVRTGNDAYRAALVLQHGTAPEDFLLAHELCVVALALGRNDRDTKWLAAASEDRFLTSLGRRQRFATQFRKDVDGTNRLLPVERALTDDLRRVMGVPPLAESAAKAAARK